MNFHLLDSGALFQKVYNILSVVIDAAILALIYAWSFPLAVVVIPTYTAWFAMGTVCPSSY